MRDTRKDKAYYSELVDDFEEALLETQEALDAGNFTSPSSRVDIAQRLFQLSIMRTVTHYSNGASIETLKPYVLAILPYRKQLGKYCDKLPEAHQVYRRAFEQLGGQGDACGSANINRYIYTLWWLSLLRACDADQQHIDEVLAIIGEQGKDALLDKIAVALGDVNRPIASTLYYPNVYQPLKDAFNASPTQQVALLNAFVQQWYNKLDEADWYDSHECDCEFEYTDYYIGYWCFELALVADILKISANALAGHSMNPTDLITT